MSLPKDSVAIKPLQLNEKQKNKEMDKEVLGKKIAMHPVLVSHITKAQMKEVPVSALAKIVTGEKEGSKFRVRINAVALNLGTNNSLVKGLSKN